MHSPRFTAAAGLEGFGHHGAEALALLALTCSPGAWGSRKQKCTALWKRLGLRQPDFPEPASASFCSKGTAPNPKGIKHIRCAKYGTIACRFEELTCAVLGQDFPKKQTIQQTYHTACCHVLSPCNTYCHCCIAGSVTATARLHNTKSNHLTCKLRITEQALCGTQAAL